MFTSQKELDDREQMLERVEAHTGCFKADWGGWPIRDVARVVQTILELTYQVGAAHIELPCTAHEKDKLVFQIAKTYSGL